MRSATFLMVLALGLALAASGLSAAPAGKPELTQEQLQEAQRLMQQLAGQFAAKQYADAADTCRQLLAIVPRHADSHYNLACCLARLGKADEAFASLAKAVECGYDDVLHMQEDEDLAPLRQDKRFADLAQKARENIARGAEKGEEIDGVKTVEGAPDGGFAYRVRMSPTAAKDAPNRLLIWFHPAGGSMNKQVEALSPQFIRHGFALLVFTKKDFRDWDSGDVAKLSRTLDDVSKIDGLTDERPLLMGFSAGGQMILTLWHGNPKGLGGLVLNSAYPVRRISQDQAQLVPPPQDEAIKTTPVYVLVGLQDGGSQVWKRAEPAYQNVGVPLTVRYIENKGHTWLLDKAEMAGLEKWLDAAAKPAPAAAPAGGAGWRPAPPTSLAEAKPALKFPEGKTSVTVPAQWGSYSLFVNVRINGQDAGYFLVNTAVPMTMIDIETAKRLSLPVVGQAQIAAEGAARQVPVHQVTSLAIGDLSVGAHAILSNDLRHVKAALGEEFSGILGATLWSQVPFTVDYEAPALVFHERSAFQPPAGAAAETLEVQDNLPIATAKFGGNQTARLVLDTGSTTFLTVAGPFAQAHGDLFSTTGGTASHLGATGVSAATEATLKRMDLFGRSFPQATVQVVPGDVHPGTAGTVGGRCLQYFILTFDYEGKKIYAKPRAAVAIKDRLGKGLKADSKDLFGITPLHLAAGDGAVPDVQALLAAKADVNAADNLGRTPLFFAAMGGRMDVVRLLLPRGANVNAAAKDGKTPFLTAAERGNVEMMQALLAAKADPKEADGAGNTAILFAALAGKAEALKFLLAKGFDAKAANTEGRTVLMAAAAAGDPDALKAVLAAGPDINARDNQDQTALMYAVVFGRKAAIETLLAAKADIYAMTRQGQTALDLAKARRLPDIAALLEQAGAK